MADEDKKEKEEGAPEAPPPAGKKKKMIIMGVCAGVVLLAGIPTAILVLGREDKKPEDPEVVAEKLVDEAQPEAVTEEDQLEEEEEPLGALFPLDTFVVNLSGGRYIRAQVQLEFTDRDIPKRFYLRMVPIRDAIITLLIEKSAEDVTNAKGKDALRAQIKDVVNEALRKQEVKNVYFTQYVVQ